MSNKLILDREKMDEFAQSRLAEPISLLRELVDYGTDLIDKCAQKGGSLSDLIIIGHFFKQAVSMLDATEILLSRCATFGAGVPARSMLEAYIYLEWLLNKDTETRARHFYVWHLRQKRQWERSFITGSDEYRRFQKHLNKLSDIKDPAKLIAREADARKHNANLTTILTSARNKSINDKFDELKKTKLFDVHWYKPAGAKSIYDMVKQLSLESEYDLFYSPFSDISHAGDFSKHINFEGKAVIFEPIRSPEEIGTIINAIATLAFRIFRLIIKKYFLSDLKSLNEHYINQWRNRFLSVPKVIVKDDSP